MENNQDLNIIKNLSKTIIIIVISFLVVGVVISKYSIGFNNSASISGKMFFIIKNSLPKEVSDKIIFKVNNSHTNNTDQNFIKKVIGFEGDLVSVENQNIYLNGKKLGYIKPKSTKNNTLYPIISNNQSFKIPNNKYFVYIVFC